MSTKPTKQQDAYWLSSSHQFMDDFKYELAHVTDNAPAVRQTTQEPFKRIHKHHAEPLLKSALEQFAPLVPHYAWGNETYLLTSPPPFGAGNRVGIVMELVNGKVRVAGTNWMPVARQGESSDNAGFFDQYDFLTDDGQKNDLICEAICGAVTSGNIELVERVECDGRRYRTMPIYLLVIDGAKRWLYCTTAVVEGPAPFNSSLECVGEVTS